MLNTIHFISHPPVFITSWVEILSIATLTTIVSGFIFVYKHFECHESGCRKIGKHPYGHLRLCGKHHPLVSGDSKKDIQKVTNSLK